MTITLNNPPEIINQASEVFTRFGMTVSEVFSEIMDTIAATGELPYHEEYPVPNAETQAVFDEIEDMIAGRKPKWPTVDLEAFFAEEDEDDDI